MEAECLLTSACLRASYLPLSDQLVQDAIEISYEQLVSLNAWYILKIAP